MHREIKRERERERESVCVCREIQSLFVQRLCACRERRESVCVYRERDRECVYVRRDRENA